MDGLHCRLKSHIKPFERQLALRELRALVVGPLVPVDGDEATALVFSVPHTNDAATLRRTLAYWSTVGTDSQALTAQLRGEATVRIARNGTAVRDLVGAVPDLVTSNLPNQRCLRYATHGLHEYRGKFFPQLVRALMNTARLSDTSIVLDPMCGSGTALVEGRLAGIRCYGMDINPLSVFITRVKCQSLSVNPEMLVAAYLELQERLNARRVHVDNAGSLLSLMRHDREYLKRWFAPRTLGALALIESVIAKLGRRRIRDFYRVCLSNVLRSVSWQKDDDLRVRRDETTVAAGETVERFLREAERSTRMVVAFLAERGADGLGRYRVYEADARRARRALPRLSEAVDAVITSPPYATALPYIDTDRLSLVYLGLLSRDQHRRRDTLMIGNREVTGGERAAYWADYETKRALLPKSARDVVERIDRLNKAEAVGFRRRNLSALLARYFLDMRGVMQQMLELLRPGGVMFLVVGNNRTTAGREQVEIETARHLRAIGGGIGFRTAEDIPMDMLVSRDIFRRNALPSERILKFEKPQ